MVRNEWTCHRGLVIHHRGVRHQRKCLCPPSYYGDECQYQNQRVAFTVRIAMNDHWPTLFHVVVILVDDRGLVESHDRIVYAPIVDCDAVKFNLYLLYRSRPKNATRNYSVQLHAYNKQGLTYHGSWLFPLRFTFLPVHRIAVHLTIPSDEPERCVFWCGGHGQCFKYINQNVTSAFYCRCDPGWSGANCTVEHHTCSRCAKASLCVGPHMCVCPLGVDGPRCYVPLHTCAVPQNNCQNGGTCLPMDRGSLDNPFICLCPPGFSGLACATIDQPILISFHTRVRIPESVLAHFLIIFRDLPLQYKTVFAKIAFDKTSVTLHTDLAFNLAFVVLPPDAYYLTYRSEQSRVLSGKNNTKAVLRMPIEPLGRCPFIHELFNDSFASLHLLRRMKYYQVPCQERPTLACFYDELHLCVCTDGYVQREAICVEINHGFQDRCTGSNQGRCHNGGQCLQKASTCPRMLLCVCRVCFYGGRCQFTTLRFGLNLDAILGYYIQPNIPFLQQPITVRASALVVTCMLLVGIFESFLAFITFQRKAVHDMGCGIYLFYNTLMSMVIILLFALKFWLLVLTQMATLTARSFLSIHCQYLDFLLRAFLNTYDWLNACVAIERAFIAFKGVSFDKGKSRRLARIVIPLVLIVTFPSNVHDPLHRHLLDIVEEERTWCVVTYDESYRIVNLTVQMIHFLVPFSVNLISAVIIIVFAARQRLRVRKEKNYKQHVVEQLQQYKNLLISPCILVLLALPRLIISFLPGCMNFIRDHGLLLTGYMLSFVPCILIFVVFVLPSKIYRKQCLLAIKQLCPKRGSSA